MPPTRVQKRNSSNSARRAMPGQFPAPPTMIPVKTNVSVRTPETSPVKRRLAITQAQKQALVDNLQLEITERARKLRAQYALQAQGLRSRLEMRVNRIPHALRQAKMGDLLAKYTEEAAKSSPGKATTRAIASSDGRKATVLRMSPAKSPNKPLPPHPIAVPSRGAKRSSAQMDDADKENSHADLDMPKKRAKTATQPAANTRATRVGSRKVQPPQVLSPRSNNSRTIPRSPLKIPTPAKPGLVRPLSPLKPTVTVGTAPASLAELPKPGKQRRTQSRHMSRAAPPVPPKAPATRARQPGAVAQAVAHMEEADEARGRTVSDSTNASETSAGTTIVAKAKKAPAAKRGITGRIAGISAVGKKVAAAAAGKKDPTPGGGRVLRKRG